MKWKKRKETRFSKDAGSPGRGARNPKLKVQVRKILRAHYAAKYRPR